MMCNILPPVPIIIPISNAQNRQSESNLVLLGDHRQEDYLLMGLLRFICHLSSFDYLFKGLAYVFLLKIS